MNMANTDKNRNIGAVMVVGAGIAGMQASLDLADAGYYVYLVDQSPYSRGSDVPIGQDLSDQRLRDVSHLAQTGRGRPASEHQHRNTFKSRITRRRAGTVHCQTEPIASLYRQIEVHGLRRMRPGLPRKGRKRVQLRPRPQSGDLHPLHPGRTNGLFYRPRDTASAAVFAKRSAWPGQSFIRIRRGSTELEVGAVVIATGTGFSIRPVSIHTITQTIPMLSPALNSSGY